MTIPGIYSQRDPRWGSIKLGFDDVARGTVYNYGCLITAIANLVWYTGNPTCSPANVNQWLKDNNGFVDYDQVVWGAVNPLLDQTNVIPAGYSADLNVVNNFLRDENNFAIAQLTKASFPMHFSVMPFVGMIADSWDGVLKSVNNYTFKGAHLYTKHVPSAPVVLPTIIEPTPVAAPPIVAPEPTPVTGTTEPVEDPTPAPTSPVEPPEPVQHSAEYSDTYLPFEGGIKKHLIVLEDTYAVDMTGVGIPKPQLAGQVLRLAGTFTDGGRTYYRGDSGSWYGVPIEHVGSNGAVTGPVPVRVVKKSMARQVEEAATEVVVVAGKIPGVKTLIARFRSLIGLT